MDPSPTAPSPPAPSPARRLAERLNILPIALFGLWLGPMLLFWAQAFGPMLPFGTPAPVHAPLPWFAASLLAGAAALGLPNGWYRLRRFEESGRLYRALGMKAFRGLVTNGDLINRIVRRRHPGYRVHPPRTLVAAAWKTSLESERSHLAAFVAGSVAIAYAGAIGWAGWALWLGATNIATNLCPVLVQRYTRTRLVRLEPRRPLASPILR